MHATQIIYRELLDSLAANSASRADQALASWLHQNPEESAWVGELAAQTNEKIPKLPVEDRWRLYALSRIADFLIATFTDDVDGLPVYSSFMRRLGLREVSVSHFHPFYHEIVAVLPSTDETAPIALTAQLWPAFMIGSMLFARAGVVVSGGRRHIRKEVAERSTLYWSYRRANRPVEDLSLGWGSNSQWRTDFRQDYHIAGKFVYNAGTRIAANPGADQLTEAQRVELVRHRCFVLSDTPHADLCPYGLRYEESE